MIKKCVLKVFNFVKKNSILENKIFFFVLKCKQKELVHNLNRSMGVKRPKSLVYISVCLFGRQIITQEPLC